MLSEEAGLTPTSKEEAGSGRQSQTLNSHYTINSLSDGQAGSREP